MAKQLKGSEFVDPKFWDQFIKGANASLDLLKEVQGVAKAGISGSSKKLEVISPDSVNNLKKFNTELNNSATAIKTLTKAEQSEIRISKQLETARKRQIKANLRQVEATERTRKAIDRERRAYQRANSLYGKVEAKIKKLTATYNEIAVKKNLGIKLTKREEIQVASLEKRLTKYQNVLKKTDASIGKHQRSVGNYKSGFDGLGFSIAQLSREAPAFANSMQTGFMAISNNIPMLVDEINKLKVANQQLAASGKPTVSIFKKLGSAIFGWQTLISIGVTLLTLYGAELVEFIKGTDEASASQERLAEATEEGNKQLDKESAELDVLFNSLKNTNAGSRERSALIDEINSKYGTTLKNIEDEVEFAEQLALAYKEIGTQIQNKITLQIVEGEISELKKQERELSKEVKKFKDLETKAQNKLNEAKSKGGVIITKSGNAISKERIAQQLLNSTKGASIKKQDELNQVLKEQNDLIEEASKLKIKLIKPTEKEIKLKSKDVTNSNKARDPITGDNIDAFRTKERIFTRLTGKGIDLRVKAVQTKRRKAREKEQEGNKKALGIAQENAKNLEKVAKLSTDIFIEQSNKRIEAIDREVKASRDKANTLKLIAAQGNLDAKESIAIEKREQDRALLQRERQVKRQKQIEASLALLKTYTSALEKTGSPSQALSQVLTSGTALAGLINSLPSFFEGTENTTGGNLDNKGGFLSVLHPNERVVPSKYNKDLNGIANSELPNAVSLYKGVMSMGKEKTNSVQNDTLVKKLDEVNKSIKSLDIPTYENTFDKTTGTLTDIVKYKYRTEITEKRGGIW